MSFDEKIGAFQVVSRETNFSVKTVGCLLNIFKPKKTNNESLVEPKKLGRLSFSQIWRRISSFGARENQANECKLGIQAFLT